MKSRCKTPVSIIRLSCLLLLAVYGLTLAACGFTPLYGGTADGGSGNAVQARLNDIDIVNIPNRQGQFLRNALIDRFYRHDRPADPAYQLVLSPVNEVKTDLDLTRNASATRSQLTVSTNLSLIDLKSGQSVLDRPLSSFASYDILDSRFTTRVSEDDAEQNALNDLARQAEQQIVLFLKR